MYTGPNIIKDNLVFGYDTGYGVADNNTSTRFYPGQPTTNLVPLSLSNSSWFNEYSSGRTLRSETLFGQPAYEFKSNTGQIWISPFAFNSYDRSSNDLVLSVYAKNIGSSSVTMNTYLGGDYSTDSLGNSNNKSLPPDSTWRRYSWSRFASAMGANYLEFRTADTGVVISCPQLEVGRYASPIVDGTRSSTQSLIDLVKTTDINVSNVSFDSNAQMNFDGTDDYIELGNALNSIGPVASFEMVFKATETNDTYRIMLGWGNGSSNYSGIHIGSWTSSYTDESFHVTFNSSTTHLYVRKGHTYYKDNAFHHAVVTAAANNYKIWIDGVDETDTVIGGSTTFSEIVGYNSNITTQIGRRPYGGGTGYFKGEIPVLKVHDKVLSETEIKQNFNAYKNRFGI